MLQSAINLDLVRILELSISHNALYFPFVSQEIIGERKQNHNLEFVMNRLGEIN